MAYIRFVAKWEPGLNPKLHVLTSAPVWLDFHAVPPHYFSEEGLEHITYMLGKPMFCHPSTLSMTNLEVARVFTIINPTNPLPEAVNVQFSLGEIHRIEVSSPWLPPTYEHCKAIGHNIKRCPPAPIICVECKSSEHKSELCLRKTKTPAKETKDVAGDKIKKKRKKNLLLTMQSRERLIKLQHGPRSGC